MFNVEISLAIFIFVPRWN